MIHSLQPGGMERVMTEIANFISSQKGFEVHLVLYGRKRDIFYSLSDSVIVHRPAFTFNNRYRMISTLRTIFFLRKKVNEIDPMSILSFGEYWNNLVLLALFKLEYPVYISDRSQPDKDLGRLQNLMKKWLYPYAAGYIAQTRKAEVITRTHGLNSNIRVIGNPVSPVKPDSDLVREKIILTVGRLIKTKHIDELIRMFAETALPGWKLVIVGGDAKKQNLSSGLKDLIRQLKVEDRVFLKGTRKEIQNFYNRSSIFAISSSSEGFPNVIGEAQSAGLPVVAFDCIAGPSDLIQNGRNGYLVELFNYEEFKKKLVLLMNDEDLRRRLGMQAREDIRKFDRNRICAEFLEFVQGGTGIAE